MIPHLLNQWAIRHRVPPVALQELLAMMGAAEVGPADNCDQEGSESAVQAAQRLYESKRGGRLWRNNVGAGELENGCFIRWGLCNESKAMNKRIKSSDLIGLRPVLITHDMVGTVIGQFLARETKPEAWRYTGTEHEAAQLAFIELVNKLGGDAKFVNRGDQV